MKRSCGPWSLVLRAGALVLVMNTSVAGAQWFEGEPDRVSAKAAAVAEVPRNVILLVADGGGANALQATRLFTGRPLAVDSDQWGASWVATYKLRGGDKPRPGPAGLQQDPAMVYDSAKAWGAVPVEGELKGYPIFFDGYRWLRVTGPDSANTMTAMVSGVRTYAGSINVDGNGTPVESAARVARRAGKRVGVVTSVPWTHATPAAGGGAQHVSRSAYHDLAEQMLSAGLVDVLGGAGHPWYDANGARRETPKFEFIGEAAWKRLEAGEAFGESRLRWNVVETPAALAAVDPVSVVLPLLMQARNGETLQQERDALTTGSDATGSGAKLAAPGEDPLLADAMVLSKMAGKALEIVDCDPDGFFLVIEGGAVDWAMHDNHAGRMIEEYIAFDDAVREVDRYLSAARTSGATWANTLVIVTADHDHLLLGPDSGTVAFQELTDSGAGKMPGYRWHSDGHSNRLVPLFARGAGAARLLSQADEVDAAKVTQDGTERAVGRGLYMQQTEIGRTIMQLLAEPARAAP
jgi:alkaline phosphatase